jgi:histidine ammonia-lyase
MFRMGRGKLDKRPAPIDAAHALAMASLLPSLLEAGKGFLLISAASFATSFETRAPLRLT